MLPLVVQPEELEDHLQDDSLLIIDLCSEEIYASYHLPGAVHVSPSELVSGNRPAVGKLPTLERLEALFSRIGYARDRHIVVYDDEGGGWAGRFIWTLDLIGHERTSYLNGGLVAWAGERRPLTQEVPTPEASTETIQIVRPELCVQQEEVLASLGDDQTQIWDARSPEEHAGLKVVAARGGHIPGAINLDWLELMDRSNNLQLPANLGELVEARGFSPDKRIITHCQTHHRSGLSYLVGKILGLNIAAYPGSWSEWGNDDSTPVENPAA